MRTPIIAGNWKCNMRMDTAFELVSGLLGRIDEIEGVEKIVCPPFVYIQSVETALTMTSVKAGAQNVHWEDDVAATGEIGPRQLAELVEYVIIGHSERRHKFGETDEETGRKVRAAFAAGLAPMLCVGEKLEERQAARTEQVVLRQLEAGLAGLDAAGVARVVIAYEPVWAIGTGVNATPADAAAVHRVIRAWLKDHTPPGTRSQILYGGSVNAKNAAELLAQDELDGVLVGGASLEVESWVTIVSAR